jgi:TPP-dependent pyruvate/acetoin dehydrogenase alpha subunit
MSESPLSLNLYRLMYRIRRAEEFIVQYYPENDMKTPMHMSMGQEAIPTAVCHALGPDGQIFASYRSHAAFLARTGNTDRFFAELYGKVTGTARGKAGSMHMADPAAGHLLSSAIVASCIPVAVGTAFANRSRGSKWIACVFFGDGAVDEGVFWESLNVACLMKLPLLFVCENNGLAVHTSIRSRQGYPSLTSVVSQFNCTVIEEKSTDVEVLHRAAARAVASIRKDGRPVFLHYSCYRYLEHVGISEDFDAGYRSAKERDEWKKVDSITLQRQRLLSGGMAEAALREHELEIDRQIESSIEKARSAPFPGREELYRGVFFEKD